MNTESFARTKFGHIFVRVLAAGMESRFRHRFFPPEKILQGVDMSPGQAVLEVGCGTGFFTIPAAGMIGEQGRLVAMDILAESVAYVTGKVRAAGLQNVQVIKGDALQTDLDSSGFDAVLLFGVIPAPMLPLNRLLAELHRVLKPEGNLAVWPPVPGWLPQAVLKSGLFTLTAKRNNVYNFKRC
jgi:ubiquinone/menaquinone biosynthesis C-methylase UbiE